MSRQALLCVALAFAAVVRGASDTPAERLPRSSPEAQGVSSAALLEFVKAADTKVDGLNSFMLVRHGYVVAQGWWGPYTANDPHWLYSMTKSFTSTAEGIAISEGRMSINDQVVMYFPKETPAAPSDNLKKVRVRDLLTMSVGHSVSALENFQYYAQDSAVARYLALPIENRPGTAFVYNSPGTFVQAAIVQKVTGMSVHDYLMPRLFEPLGIGNPDWNMNPQGINLGESGLFLRTEDIASFGQLLLQKGNWKGRQLVPAEWIEAATSKQVSNGSDPTSDWDCGYGYQFWRCRPGFFRADGAFGQFCFVMPQYDAVLALTSGVKDTQGEMNMVYDNLLPALFPAPLPADPAGEAVLKQATAGLMIKAPKTQDPSPLAAQFMGNTYVFPENPRHIHSVSLQAVNGEIQLTVTGEGIDGPPITVGSGTWARGHTKFGTDINPAERFILDMPVAAIGGWTSPDTFAAKLCYYQTPYSLTLQLQFGGDIVVLDGDYNVSFKPNAITSLVGRKQAPGTEVATPPRL